jgi:GNAT superfamily N-acetyltransferase
MLHIRQATKQDVPAIQALMKESMKLLGEGYHSESQLLSCCKYVCVPDLQLIEDGTFFVVTQEGDDSMIGCGGWSFRNTLYAGPASNALSSPLNPEHDPARIRAMFTAPSARGKGIGSLILSTSETAAKTQGFKKGTLGATLSGLAFYQAKGWKALQTESATLPDGTIIDVIKMEKAL